MNGNIVKGNIVGRTVAFILKEPRKGSEIAGYIGCMTDVDIYVNESVNGYCKVKTNFGIEGFCEENKIYIQEG